jgi:TM2 domain-containing membrane protein YozV
MAMDPKNATYEHAVWRDLEQSQKTENKPKPPSGKRLPAGICGILFGALGIHKFIIGQTTAGLVMLLVTVLTLGIGGTVMELIGIIEGIIYLTKSDAEFDRIYIDGRKAWF